MTHQKKAAERVATATDRELKMHLLSRTAKEINDPERGNPIMPEHWEQRDMEDRDIWEAEQAGDNVSF